jgi:hypothetical protein
MRLTYDLGACPASWDFLQWLINVEIVRRVNCRTSLGIHFRPGPRAGFRDDNMPRPIAQRRAILENVMRPGLSLVGATETGTGETNIIPYTVRFAVDYSRSGGPVPFFNIPQTAIDEVNADLRGRSPLVITLREAAYIPERNSNLPVWIEFARSCGDDVIFVRDTAKADEPIEGFETSPKASRGLMYRAALMQRARCNLMVANGPWVLALYSSSPWLNFGALRPHLNWSPGHPEWWERHMGCPVGSQFPWAMQNQRMVWGDDTLENINAAWSAIREIKSAA